MLNGESADMALKLWSTPESSIRPRAYCRHPTWSASARRLELGSSGQLSRLDEDENSGDDDARNGERVNVHRVKAGLTGLEL